ncbi:PhaM family polyhydroxyalkanoate granule multifunctional regulatory protein [Hydrogenophaga sp. 5NK40-0174]|uniref:PhaM family polyhydroxyalkanoate granule multifunctional regulatory protein n=1 Tax=Hydrogenophaga sp. 5NK40-0174 TaxID=3127649 RepID=UPI003108FDAA
MSESSGFGKFVPGFDFLQNLAGQAASGVAQGISQNMPQLPNLSHWIAPTFNVEELDKRIEELKAVHYWLDQNAKALGATIQALEVQKMTLATLEHMNFSMGDVANAFKLKAADSAVGLGGSGAPVRQPAKKYSFKLDEASNESSEMASEPPAPPKRRRSTSSKSHKTGQTASSAKAAPNLADPMQWWGGLTQQFQSIAANAMKDAARNAALDSTRDLATDMTGKAMKTATDMAGKVAGTMMGTAGAMAGVGKAAMGSAAKKAGASTRKAAAKAPAGKAKTKAGSASGARKSTARKTSASKKPGTRKTTTGQKKTSR